MRYANTIIRLLGLGLVLITAVHAYGQGTAGTARGSVRLPEGARDVEETRGAEEAGAADKAAPAAGDEEVVKEELVYLNVQDQDIKDVIKQISKATGKNFIIDDKIRGKITIMSEKMMTKEEAYQAFLSALEVAGYTTVTGPGGVIKVVSLKDAVSSPIPIHVDSTPYTDSFVTRLISLNNISALEMSQAIKGLISKAGNMFAYPATNTLIITDSGTNIDRLMKIIKELDQEGPQQVLEIVPIKHADAKEVASMVLSLFEIEQQQTTRRTTRRSRRAAASQLQEIKDVSKIIADERTNSIIVVASKRAISRVRDVIAQLDVPLDEGDSGQIHVHYLRHANAPDLAQTLSAITSGAKASATKGKKGEGGAVAELEGGINIGADETTNALIITASAKDYRTIVDELISKLDIPRRQVYLEAVIMELGITKTGDYGVSGFGGAGNSSMLGFGNVGYSDMNVLSSLFDPTSFFATPGMLGGLISRDTVTIDVPQSGGGTTQLTIPAFAAFLNLIQTYQDSNVVSTPNLLTLDNQKASMEVTRTIYAAKTTSTATTGAVVTEPQPLEAGLVLEITPQITEGDGVKMEIHSKLENFTGAPGPAGVADKAKREITTTVVVNDGQTVVLGGLMEDNISHSKSKVPILGDIPLLGLLFQHRSSQATKNNLLVFITPYVIRDPTDFAEVTEMKINQRNRFIDANFGKRQRRQIRETIAMHRADLIEFSQLRQQSGAGASSKAQPVSMAGPQQPPPVITAQPMGKQRSEGGGESSAAKPVQTAPGRPQPGQAGKVDLSY